MTQAHFNDNRKPTRLMDMARKKPEPMPVMTVPRFPTQDPSPVVQCGQRPAKAVVGERVPITITAFREGHDALGVEVVILRPNGSEAGRARMTPTGVGLDRWQGVVRPDAEGLWHFRIDTWSDVWETWRQRAVIKIPAGSDVDLELAEGANLVALLAKTSTTRTAIAGARDTKLPPMRRLAHLLDPSVLAAMEHTPLRRYPSTSPLYPLRVERRRALFGSWYEFFPRSEGNFRAAAERLPAIAAMGFDVVYLPPIHPIGHTFRKGPNNTLPSGPGDPGSPWAIGSAEGGHDAIHPGLGRMADFEAFVARAKGLNLEIALDLALQVSPDHPWVSAHPEWFTTRADGTIAYAENPPKKYQDIYPLNFDNDPEGLYAEVLRVVRLWMSKGVRIFRVDNPHTKPLWVWDRLINQIRSTDPDVFFLAEAFTRPAMMRALAEVGFQQSYTYFTWRNDRFELEEYLTELSGPAAAYMRPNLFVNTPDILSEYLQYGGPAAFAIRAILAATLSPTWGVYSGFELYESTAVRQGSEEYLNSEKYQLRSRDWEVATDEGKSLVPLITCLNDIRRLHPALQDLRSLRFHHSDNDGIIAFSKRDRGDLILVVCSVDPMNTREATVRWDMEALGLSWDASFTAHDLLSGNEWTWGRDTYVRLDPRNVAHIVHVTAGSV
jgi:starch synthase (maltosyl-transferring)